MIRKNGISLLLLTISVASCVQAMNLLQPYDILVRPQYRLNKNFHLDFFAEHGFSAHGFNNKGCRVNPLQIWNTDQNALAMLQGFEPSSEIGQLLTNLRADGAIDDGVRGHYQVTGNLQTNWSFALSGRWQFYKDFFLTAHIPAYGMQLTDVCWQEQTNMVSAGDFSIKNKLTNDFFDNVCRLGDGLYLGPWKRHGFGDLVVYLQWLHDFKQEKPFLKNVRLNWRIGNNFPTGLRANPDLIMALPFGFNGTLGILYGFNIECTLGHYFKVGFGVDLQQLFGNKVWMRIKTHEDQSELLLLQKAQVYVDYGMNQRFTIFGQLFNLGGLGLKAGYEFSKHGEDVISVCTQAFSNEPPNFAEKAQEVTAHQCVAIATYDFANHFSPDAKAIPSLAFYARMPFNGKRAVLGTAIGGWIAVDF